MLLLSAAREFTIAATPATVTAAAGWKRNPAGAVMVTGWLDAGVVVEKVANRVSILGVAIVSTVVKSRLRVGA